MPRADDSGSARNQRERQGYKFSSSITEDSSAEPQATYGVQFCLKPSKYHLQGGGSWWENRGPLHPDQHCGHLRHQDRDADNSAEKEIAETKPDQLDSRWRNLFVTCNGAAVRVYEARKKQKPLLLQVYEDEDESEVFYCVGWTYNVNGRHEWWVCAAGKKGVLRVINVQEGAVKSSCIGHGEAINDLKVHPRDPALVITASKDESLRLWNIRTGSTVAVFAGLKGHRGEVVHVDFNREGSVLASCGIDNSVRIWEVDDNQKVIDAIKESHEVADLGITDTYVYTDKTGTRRRTKVPICQFPYFVTRKVHKHYVDCVMFVGDLLLSKSVHNRMFLWEPKSDRESLSSPATEYTLLEEYVLDRCDVWFIRFGMDRTRHLVACGNDKVGAKIGSSRTTRLSELNDFSLTCYFRGVLFIL